MGFKPYIWIIPTERARRLNLEAYIKSEVEKHMKRMLKEEKEEKEEEEEEEEKEMVKASQNQKK